VQPQCVSKISFNSFFGRGENFGNAPSVACPWKNRENNKKKNERNLRVEKSKWRRGAREKINSA
jgi:hypothetical protein